MKVDGNNTLNPKGISSARRSLEHAEMATTATMRIRTSMPESS